MALTLPILRLSVLAAIVLGCGNGAAPPEAKPPNAAPTLSAVAASSSPPPANANAKPAPKANDWVSASNENAKLLITILTAFEPEGSSRLGVEGHEEQIVDLKPGHEARRREAERGALAELRRRMTVEREPRVLQDLAILVHAADLSIRSSEVQEQHLVPYVDVTELVFGSTLTLLDDQIPQSRRQAIVARLRKYAGMEGGAPIVELVEAEIREAMKNPKRAMPAKIEVEKHLATNAVMRDGIGKLLQKYGIQGWEEPHKRLMEQLVTYDEFVKKTVLPKARDSFVLPPPVYAIALEGYGVDMPPAQLTALAHAGFTQIQAEMKTVAAEVAKARGLPSSDYRDVIKSLKKESLGDDVILQHYKDRLAEIEGILRREKLVTLPSRAARIRLATPAESAQQPAPHMMPPRLLGNTGEQGEFILPLELPPEKGTNANAADKKLDDFKYGAASWALTAHEARPGHEMQFAAIVENGVSIARMVYAFNSANVEGWGLYSEAIVFPFMPPEGRLVSLQLRLQRAARAFLDPELQQGKWTFAKAKEFLVHEVGLSPAFATTEVERYTFRMPGQATSYYYGYSKLIDLRREVEARLGPKFDPMRFHDFILAQGLLPPALLRDAVLEELTGATRSSPSR